MGFLWTSLNIFKFTQHGPESIAAFWLRAKAEVLCTTLGGDRFPGIRRSLQSVCSKTAPHGLDSEGTTIGVLGHFGCFLGFA